MPRIRENIRASSRYSPYTRPKIIGFFRRVPGVFSFVVPVCERCLSGEILIASEDSPDGLIAIPASRIKDVDFIEISPIEVPKGVVLSFISGYELNAENIVIGTLNSLIVELKKHVDDGAIQAKLAVDDIYCFAKEYSYLNTGVSPTSELLVNAVPSKSASHVFSLSPGFKIIKRAPLDNYFEEKFPDVRAVLSKARSALNRLISNVSNKKRNLDGGDWRSLRIRAAKEEFLLAVQEFKKLPTNRIDTETNQKMLGMQKKFAEINLHIASLLRRLTRQKQHRTVLSSAINKGPATLFGHNLGDRRRTVYNLVNERPSFRKTTRRHTKIT